METSINNFQLLESKLNFSDSDKFYFVQILKRRKDNPTMEKGVEVLKTFCIDSLQKYEKLAEQIQNFCEINNARAYINLNRRGHKKVALQLLRKLAERVSQESYDVKNLYDSVCGEFSDEPNKTWVLDLDGVPRETLTELQKRLNEFELNCFKFEVPTKNGCHFILTPTYFNKFVRENEKLLNGLEYELHKNNPTFLYSPLNP